MAEPPVLEYAGEPPPRSLSFGLRVRLSLMMFLQYAVWGAWWVVLAKYLVAIGFSGEQIGKVYATMAIASIFAPPVFGQIADRWLPTQYVLAVCHMAGAVMLFLALRYTAFGSLYACVLIYALLYIPTISLTNALSLHQIPDAAKHFPGIRVFGTIGWIAAGLFVGWQLQEDSTQPIRMAAVLSAVLGVYCLFLPHTPPSGRSGDVFAFTRAFGMLRDPQFSLFIVVSFIISVVLAGYYLLTAVFLGHPPLNITKAASIMTVGQFTEMLLLPFLPFFLKRLGMKWTLVLGMAAWGVRYGIFAVGQPVPLIVVALALHGICYDFFFVAAYIHVDNRAMRDFRASAQAMFNLVTMGLGMWLGTRFFGWLFDALKSEEGVVNWTLLWAWPTLGVVAALAIFIVGFREKRAPVALPEAAAEPAS